MTKSEPTTRSETPHRRRPQFGMGSLLMVMLVCSVMAAAGSYFVRSALKPGGASLLVFILFTLVTPVVLMIVVSLTRQIALWLSRRRR
ncbi:MAG: hypothetical protein GX575_12385 [Candidatus Anammoximicrobium sp.]|nr:hypothetical protein [Candidatus Anammoximicrobium sp.]